MTFKLNLSLLVPEEIYLNLKGQFLLRDLETKVNYNKYIIKYINNSLKDTPFFIIDCNYNMIEVSCKENYIDYIFNLTNKQYKNIVSEWKSGVNSSKSNKYRLFYILLKDILDNKDLLGNLVKLIEDDITNGKLI